MMTNMTPLLCNIIYFALELHDKYLFYTSTPLMWFNGCACQFQSSLRFSFVFWYSYIIRGCGMSWFFFGIGHGKGESDMGQMF